MRITNKMMTGNSLSNINTNKEYLDKLNNQMATEKKITRPSDDPIIAIRALRLRSELSEISQYYGANVPDAQAWVSVTQSAINSTKEILSSLKSYADQGANGTNTASDRQKIYENMNALKTQVYANGNATNAGRYVFSGYRTGESLTFPKDTEAYYRDIKDTFNASDVVKAHYTEGEISMEEINKLETDADYSGTVTPEQAIKDNEVYRIRLSYDDLEIDGGDIRVSTLLEDSGVDYSYSKADNTATIKAGDDTVTLTKNADGTVTVSGAISATSGTDTPLTVTTSGGATIVVDDNLAVTKAVKTSTYTDATVLTYREKLSGTQNPSLSIPASTTFGSTTKPGKDPVTGVIYAIKLTDENGNAITLSNEDGFTQKNSPVTGSGVGGGTVTVHNDGTITYMTDTDSGRSVYNISADGRTITSYYMEADIPVTVVNSTDAISSGSGDTYEDIYAYMKLNAAGASENDETKNLVYMVKDTGELIMGSSIATKLSELPDVTGVDSISVKYNKTRFSEGDVKPQHYFDCIGYEDGDKYENKDTDNVLYDSHEQSIYYTVGTNQQIQINTYAEDVFDTQIMREIDDVLAAIDMYNNAETKVNKLQKLSEERSGKDTNVEDLLKAAKKELDLAKNKLQSTYEDAITQFGNFFDQANLADTATGTVQNRLDLVSNRLAEEKTTVTTLASDNENVDITDIAVEISEANLVYNAALMSTGRISQQTLVDYI